MNNGLTRKQQLFVAAYLSNGLNATEAARQAAYKGNDVTLGAVGAENLKKPLIAAFIEEEQAKLRVHYAERREGLLADVDEVKREIQLVAQTFPDNGNVRLGLIGKRLDAIEKEAKLTGAYVQERPNAETLANTLQIFNEWLQFNPNATTSERSQAIQDFARLGKVDEKVLREKVGVIAATEAVN